MKYYDNMDEKQLLKIIEGAYRQGLRSAHNIYESFQAKINTMSKEGRIGRGQHMSIAKAALKYYFEETEQTYLTYDELEAVHRIVDIAGCNHCGPATSAQVMSCIASSPYWIGEFIPSFYPGIPGHGGATIYQPTTAGIDYYYQTWGAAFPLNETVLSRFEELYKDFPFQADPTKIDPYKILAELENHQDKKPLNN